MSLNFDINKFKFGPVIFSDRFKFTDLEEKIRKLPKNSTIIIREYDLDDKKREILAKNIIFLAKKQKITVLIGKNINLAKKIGANGVHFSDFDQLPLKFLRKFAFPKNFIFSFSCHSEKSLRLAQNIKANLVFISPAFLTTSHSEQKCLGSLRLAKIALQKEKVIYDGNLCALGGVNAKNIKLIKKLKFDSFGAIDLFKNL